MIDLTKRTVPGQRYGRWHQLKCKTCGCKFAHWSFTLDCDKCKRAKTADGPSLYKNK